jgi:hypothetical protein
VCRFCAPCTCLRDGPVGPVLVPDPGCLAPHPDSAALNRPSSRPYTREDAALWGEAFDQPDERNQT